MFSVLQGVILAPLPFPQANRLVFLWQNRPGIPQLDVSYPNFEDWERTSRSFSTMSAVRFHNFDLTAPGSAEHLVGIRASYGLLATLGVQPVIGRDFTASEDEPNAGPAALISYSLWRERFASDPHVTGRALVLDGKSFTVIGVLPAGFHFLADADVLTALRPDMPAIYADRSVDAVPVVARLKSGVTTGQAEAEMNAIQQGLDRLYPDANRTVGVTITSLSQEILGDVRGTILLLFGAVSLVLLIACFNLANLLLARSTARAREFGIRSALGAGRGRIVRQLLTENVVLSLAGGILGIVVAGFGLRLLLAALPYTLPRSANIGLHLPVLLYTVLASISVGILSGLAPALRCASPDVQGALQKASRGSSSRHRPLSRIVVVQFALTLVLMTGAGLLLRSVRNLWHVNPGFDTNHVILFRVGLSPSSTTTAARTRAAYQQLLARILELPGVAAADLTNIVPLSGADNGGPFWIGTRQPTSLQEAPHALYFWTGPDYLKTMGIPLLQGRFFTPADQISSGKVVVIDSVLAHTFFPGQNPVGQTLTVGHWGAARIVGVVGHVRHWGLEDRGAYNSRQIYIPVYQLPDSIAVTDFFRTLTLVVRTTLPPADLMPAIRNVVFASASDQPVYGVSTIDDLMSESMASRNLPILLLGAFAALALLLSSVGIYGVVSYSVMRRTQEIGIRLALGADRGRVFRMIVGHGMRMAGVGLGIGALTSVALVHLLPSFSHLLYGVGQSDPLTLFGVSTVLLLAALIACYVPGRRAMRTDPMHSLRCE